MGQESELILTIEKVGALVMRDVSSWAKENSYLELNQRSIAYTVGKNLANSKSPSAKQAYKCVQLLLEVIDLGYEHKILRYEVLDRVESHRGS